MEKAHNPSLNFLLIINKNLSKYKDISLKYGISKINDLIQNKNTSSAITYKIT